ncbi:hypothetical protein TNCV_1984431 [Trichonephila clavipes]|nr:hypothetical protein TNCV_1984431 [Trichonephila clavipes]
MADRWVVMFGSRSLRAAAGQLNLIKIRVNQDVSWSSDEGISWISRDSLDRWVVMPIHVAKEVNCKFTDRLSDGRDVT